MGRIRNILASMVLLLLLLGLWVSTRVWVTFGAGAVSEVAINSGGESGVNIFHKGNTPFFWVISISRLRLGSFRLTG